MIHIMFLHEKNVIIDASIIIPPLCKVYLHFLVHYVVLLKDIIIIYIAG